MRIAIVGAGRLGSVFTKVLSRNHEILLIDKDFQRAVAIASLTGAQAVKDVAVAKTADMAIIAVKPAHVEEVVKEVKDSALIVSCAAGIPISKFESWGAKNTIRIMPNICAEVGEAVIAYSLHAEVEKKERFFLAVFSSLGMCIKTDESHLDTITAISGSGPAFAAFFAKAMVEEAIRNGLDADIAEKLVAQTFLGTGKLMRSGWGAERIISTVATPGGTTEAGLTLLHKRNTDKSIHAAIRLAVAKAMELGK